MKKFFKNATAVLIAVVVLAAVLAAIVALEWATIRYAHSIAANSEVKYIAIMIGFNAAYYVAVCAIQKII